MCITIQDKCPCCEIVYLNYPQPCSWPEPPFCSSVVDPPADFNGLQNPFNDTMRTRWCDDCILRSREYDDVMACKQRKESDLSDLYAEFVTWVGALDQDVWCTSDQYSKIMEFDDGKVYYCMKAEGLPEEVTQNEDIKDIEQEIWEAREAIRVLEVRMEVLVRGERMERGWEEPWKVWEGRKGVMRTRGEWMVMVASGGVVVLDQKSF